MRHPKSVLLAALLLPLAPALAQDEGGEVEVNRVAAVYDDLTPGLDQATSERVQILYTGYFLGIEVMKADLAANASNGAYEAGGIFRTSGLAGWFDDTDIEVRTFGALDAAGVAPRMYQHMNHASSKNRTVAIDFEGGVAEPVVTPDFGSHGDPPPSVEDLTGAIDPISTFVAISMGSGAEPCARDDIRVFDGKQRYDLRFEAVGMEDVDVRGYEGPALHCHIFYTPVSGYDPEDLAEPEVYARPMNVWLAQFGDDRWMPVRVRMRASGVNVAVEAKRVFVTSSGEPIRAASDEASTRG